MVMKLHQLGITQHSNGASGPFAKCHVDHQGALHSATYSDVVCLCEVV